MNNFVFHYVVGSRKNIVTPPDVFFGDDHHIFKRPFVNDEKKCHIYYYIKDDKEIFLKEIFCNVKGNGRIIILDLLKFLTDDLTYKQIDDPTSKKLDDSFKVSLNANANWFHQKVWKRAKCCQSAQTDEKLADYHANYQCNSDMFINQKCLVEYYKLLGFKIADKDHKEIVDPGHYELSQPMTSTIGEIKKAIENMLQSNRRKIGNPSSHEEEDQSLYRGEEDSSSYEEGDKSGEKRKRDDGKDANSGGKAKSKRNKSRRRLVFRKSRRQIKKRN